MVLGVDSLVSIIVFAVIGIILIVVCLYCCTCKPAWINMRRNIINRQIARDEENIDREREASRAQIRETLTNNEQERDDIRNKYQLKK